MGHGTLPGGWISSADLDLSLPHFGASESPAAILPDLPFNLSPFPPPSVLPLSRSPALSKPPMSHLDRVTNFHRRLSNSLFSSDSSRRESRFFKPAALDTPQSVPSLLEEGSSAATTPSFSAWSEELPPMLPPLHFPTTPLPDDAVSITSRVTRLSFGPSVPSFSPESPFDSPSIESGSIIDPGWDFSSPVYRHAYLHHSSSFESSIIDAFPSSASIKRIPSIPSLSSELQLNNLPNLAASSLLFDPHVYFNAGDIPAPSLLDSIPVVSQTPSLTSLSDPFGHTAQQLHKNMVTTSNPPASRRNGRVVVREHIHVEGQNTRMRKDTWTYGCEILPYSAGFRPHLYIDNSERSVSRKKSIAGQDTDDRVEVVSPSAEDEGVRVFRSPAKLMKKLVGGGKVSRFLGLRGAKKNRGRKGGKGTTRIPPTSIVSPFLGSVEVIADDLPPPTTHKAGRVNKKFSVPRPLSMFLVPKPRVELLDRGRHSDNLGLLDESFEAITNPGEEAENGLIMSSELPSFFPAKKDMDAKNRRRKSWFNLTSSSSGLLS